MDQLDRTAGRLEHDESGDLKEGPLPIHGVLDQELQGPKLGVVQLVFGRISLIGLGQAFISGRVVLQMEDGGGGEPARDVGVLSWTAFRLVVEILLATGLQVGLEKLVFLVLDGGAKRLRDPLQAFLVDRS